MSIKAVIDKMNLRLPKSNQVPYPPPPPAAPPKPETQKETKMKISKRETKMKISKSAKCGVCGDPAIAKDKISVSGRPRRTMLLCQPHLDAAKEEIPKSVTKALGRVPTPMEVNAAVKQYEFADDDDVILCLDTAEKLREVCLRVCGSDVLEPMTIDKLRIVKALRAISKSAGHRPPVWRKVVSVVPHCPDCGNVLTEVRHQDVVHDVTFLVCTHCRYQD